MRPFGILKTALLVLLSSVLVSGAVTGKIAGIVTDAQSGVPLAGANVLIEGTTLGAAADLDGNYILLNIPPGKYILKFMMIGYKSVIVRDVVVVMNITTTINAQLNTEALGMDEVVVVAKRPVVVKDISHSQLNIEAEQIATLPVGELTQVVGLQAGVKGFEVRGGAERQTALIVDGFLLSDARSNNPIKTVSLATVKEVQVQTGGFMAEYGNVRSGVINVTTEEGKMKYSGTLAMNYKPAAPKHFGISPYDRNSYFNRVYYDPDVCYVGTSAGSWDAWTRKQYPTFEGWNSLSNAYLRDSDPKNDLSPEALVRLYEWQHRRQGDIKKPDYIFDAAFSGPVPLLQTNPIKPRFYFAYRKLQEMLIVPLSQDAYREEVFQGKITADLTPKTVMTLFGLHSKRGSATQYEWTTTPTGDILRSDYTIASLTSSRKELLYVPGALSPCDIYDNVIGIKINHVISPRTFFETAYSYTLDRYNAYQMEIRDTTDRYEIVDGYLVDESPYGYWGYGVSSLEGLRYGGWMNLGRDSSEISTHNFRFDFTSQLNKSNEIKAGVNFIFNKLDIKSTTENWGMSTWERSQVYTVKPYHLGAYVSDKLDYEGFIGNLGLHLDILNSNSDVFQLSTYDTYYRSGYGSRLEDEVKTAKSKTKVTLSPRLGVSHPITDNSKLFFNYGHYRSEPASTYRFRLQREYNGLVTSIGNPDLNLEKTVSYELGYSHNLFNQILLNVTAYYKDITDQIGWIYYQNINSSVQYNKASNNNYQDIRGFEITLDKKTGTWFSGFVNYTYMVTSTGYFGIQRYYQDPSSQRTYLMDNPAQDKPKPQPYARASLDFHTPMNFGPSLMGVYPVGGWNLNVLARWTQGEYATYNPTNIPGLINNVQWKDTWNFDTRLTKNFTFKRFSILAYLQFTNLFNFKYLSYAGFVNNRDYLDYMESLHLDWEKESQHGQDRIGEYRKNGVDFVPMQDTYDVTVLTSPDTRVLYYDLTARKYMQYVGGQWVERSKSWVQKEILDKKAYIDMPNNTSFTFLYPREIQFGLKINF